MDVEREVARHLPAIADAALHLGHYARGLALVARGLGRPRPDEAALRASELRIRWTMGEVGADARPDERCPAGRLLAGRLAVGRGRFDTAHRTLRAVADEACGTGDLAVAAEAVAELTRSARTAADDRVGRALASEVLDALARRRVWLWAAPLLPFVQLDLLRGTLPDYRDGTAGRDAPLARAALDFAEARLSEQGGDVDSAAAAYRAACHRYADLPNPRMAAHARAAETRCRLAAARPPDADLLRQAWRTFVELGDDWDADRLKQLIRSAGLPAPHRRGRPGYGNRLSPREREVAELAVEGHTNRDIATQLYLSDRTVKYHLANAMRKHKVHGRRELCDALEDGEHTCRCAGCGRELDRSSPDR